MLTVLVGVSAGVLVGVFAGMLVGVTAGGLVGVCHRVGTLVQIGQRDMVAHGSMQPHAPKEFADVPWQTVLRQNDGDSLHSLMGVCKERILLILSSFNFFSCTSSSSEVKGF